MPASNADKQIKVRCSPEAHKLFKIAQVEAELDQRQAVDTAFRLFAIAVRSELEEKRTKQDAK